MTLLKVERKRLRLSRELSRWLGRDREVAAFLEGDTVVLKKIMPPSILSLARRGRPMSMEEINAEVKRARRAAR